MQNELYYRGDDLTVLASQCVSANTIAAGQPKSGEAVMVGDLAGVATTSPALATESFAVRTKGVFSLSVTGNNGAGAAVTVGAKVYFDTATGLLSINAAKVFFGWALGAVNAAATTLIPVKLKQ